MSQIVFLKNKIIMKKKKFILANHSIIVKNNCVESIQHNVSAECNLFLFYYYLQCQVIRRTKWKKTFNILEFFFFLNFWS